MAAKTKISFLLQCLILAVVISMHHVALADVGILSFWVPELYALLEEIQAEGNEVTTHIFGARKFYVTKYKGHNVVAVNTGVGISNTAATTAILLQKFPTIDRIVGSGIAGGVDPSLRVGDVVIPERWALYQKQHFAKEKSDGSYDIPASDISGLLGEDCGPGTTKDCQVGVDTWNYSFIFPTASHAADPTSDGPNATIEESKKFKWFEVDPEMFAVAESIASNVTLKNADGDAVLDYQPVVVTGGNGVAGPTFMDNADYRQYISDTFEARAVDMESAAAASVAFQFGKKYIFFRSLSDLAGGGDGDNTIDIFYGVAAANAVTTMTAFLEKLPTSNSDEDNQPTPNDFSPGEDTEGLLGVLSFYAPELVAMKKIMKGHNGGEPEELIFGGRKFYRGKIGNADVVATLTGVSITNAAMTTALMLMLYPGVERLIGGGIAGGADPDLNVGDVVIPERWANYQMDVFSRELDDGTYLPVAFEQDLLVGPNCGGWDGISEYLLGDAACNFTDGETSNFNFMFPKTIQAPDPSQPLEINRISEGDSRKWWFEVDSEMYEIAKEATAKVELKNKVGDVTLPTTPRVVAGGNGVTGSTFLDNAAYRTYAFEQFQARCVEMETAAAADIAFQNDIPFLFFRSLSDLAGGDQDSNVMGVFFAVAAENAFAVTLAFVEAMYPDDESDDISGASNIKLRGQYGWIKAVACFILASSLLL